MTTRDATCNCGQLKVHVVGEPIRISVCHCFACQRRTGSPFGMQARFERTNFSAQGAEKTYVRTADSGNKCVYHFCPLCGSTVYYHLEGAPDVPAVPVGAFGDPAFPEPKFSVYEERKHVWIKMPEGIERMD